MSNMYKLYTKVLSNMLVSHCELTNAISFNQAGTKRGMQGSKEQFLINKSILKTKGTVKTLWLDIKKAFDSVNQEKLLDMLLEIKAPNPVINFFKIARRKWVTKIIHEGKSIGETRIQRGLLQDDSLSPILFINSLKKEDIPAVPIRLDEGT